MKKIVTLCLLICFLVLGGCSQASPGTQSAPAPQDKPKSDYPNKTIELIVPFAAGGATDLVARILKDIVPKYLPKNQTIVVVNKPGGGGVIGANEVLNAKPDGYTVGLLTHGNVALVPHQGKAKYTYESFQPVAKVTGTQQVLYVRSDAPWKTFEEWLDYVKKNPGTFTYGPAAGLGSGAHIPMVMLRGAAKTGEFIARTT